MSSYLIEALVVGVLTAIIGVLMTKAIKFNLSEPRELVVFLLVLGVIIHLLCESTGINHWYCKNGNACQV